MEKYLKAFLAIFLKKIERTHNLEFLIEQCIQIDKDFIEYEEKFDQIAECGVEVRYPDTFIIFEDDELVDMMVIIEEFRKFVLEKINIAVRISQSRNKRAFASREAKILIDETGYFRRKEEKEIINYK